MKQFFTAKYLFYINSVQLDTSDKVFFALGSLMIVLAFIFKLASVLAPTPIDKKYRGKFFSLFLTIGISEVVWYGARVQDVGLFGTHFVALLILLIGLTWFVVVVAKLFKNYAREKTDYEKEQVKLKYLPK